MNMWGSPLAVEVDAGGLTMWFGPFDGMPAGMRFVSEHVYDVDRYQHRYLGLVDPAEAGKLLNRNPHATDESGLFGVPPREEREPLEAAIRAAICREHGDPGEGPHGDGLYAHLDVHRPWRVELKSEECWEGECDHPLDGNGLCTAPARRELWCRGCTPLYVSGGEWDGTPYAECRVNWPCSPVLAMAAYYEVPLTGKLLGGPA
jgi:hypothetical protein